MLFDLSTADFIAQLQIELN